MRKRIASLLLILALCFTLLPTAALAADSSKISITTVDELLQFAKAVDNGEYDDKTDAVVSLDADLDLTGVAWKPIGSVFDGDGNLLHYFSGKFYGNGHTISNLDFSENYGKTEYPSFGFFSEVYDAEISGLTIQGKLDVSNSGYVYFGTVAGVAAGSKITDCVSDVSFTDTNIYINGTAALCGYAINSTIEHCQNKGNFSVTTDTTSLQMGGIVGVADNSTVQYCANTGDMTSWTPHTGGIVGQLYQGSKIINCYSTGKMVPLGHGTTDFGGIAGTVGAGTEIRHCYFAGEMNLSQYTATTPYKRLGGIAGGVSSDTPVFENNYFMETENVPACFKYQDAGTEKTLDFMKTEDFFNEITAAGGNYRFNSNGTPLLPAPKYTVSFVVTPAELANVVIKVNGQAVANPADLEAGTYTVEVNADNCEVFNSNITITADTATHTQTIAMTYLPADYTKVDEAIAKLSQADGLVIGAPVHYASPAGAMLSFLDRMFFAGSKNFAHKPGACVTSARRAGTTASLDVLSKYLTISQMPLVSAHYWPMVHGGSPEEVRQDAEGMQVMRRLGDNMAWLLRCIEAGREKGIEPQCPEQRVFTNFVR